MVVAISTILTWSRYFLSRGLSPERPEILEHSFQVRPELNDKVSLWQGDITTVAADAIVNAANSSLLGGGGVDGAIHSAAGEQLRVECEALNGCDVGDAKITKGCNLPAKYVIHTVGSMTENPSEQERCYQNSFKLMLQHSLRSIVFPCISTGVYGYDPEEAAHVALYETRMFLKDHHDKVDRVVFCVYRNEDLKIYEELLQRYFPVEECENSILSEEEMHAYFRSHPEEKADFESVLKKKESIIISFPKLPSKV